ncbi:MAG: hypothetical protein DI626_07310, partial [Micavibrio aeruginosavorus]
MADLGNPLFKNAPHVAKDFKKATEAGIAQRLGTVAAHHDYTVIADMDHRSPSAYSIISKDQSMAALKSAGVKHIAVEMLNPSDQPILDAYANGEISDRAMKHFYQDRMTFNTGADYGTSDKPVKKSLVEMIQNAKQNGISI